MDRGAKHKLISSGLCNRFHLCVTPVWVFKVLIASDVSWTPEGLDVNRLVNKEVTNMCKKMYANLQETISGTKSKLKVELHQKQSVYSGAEG